MPGGGTVKTEKGETRELRSEISRDEGEFIQMLIRKRCPRRRELAPEFCPGRPTARMEARPNLGEPAQNLGLAGKGHGLAVPRGLWAGLGAAGKAVDAIERSTTL